MARRRCTRAYTAVNANKSEGGAILADRPRRVDITRRPAMPAKRTTHRSSTGKKLYAVRDSKGQFKDIQTYKRAHTMDMKRTSKAEKSLK